MQAATLGNGLSGGFPGSAGMFWSAERTRVVEMLAAGTWPDSREQLREMAPDGGMPPAKKFDNPLREADVFEVVPPLAAGHGDPLLRDVDLVGRDLAHGRVTGADAERIYGVILDDDGQVDLRATAERRSRVREERLARMTHRPPVRSVAPETSVVLCHATETVSVREIEAGPRLCCASCRQVLGTLQDGYRDGCGWLEGTLEEIDPDLFVSASEQLEESLVLRHYVCPGCAALLDAEICRPESPSYIDVLLRDPSAARR